jgi:hypothetical protein
MLVECLSSFGVSNPEDHIQAAIDQGKTPTDIEALIAYYRAAQSQRKPPGAALLASWLKGKKAWPSIKQPKDRIVTKTSPPPPQPHRTLKEKLDARGVPPDIDYSKCGAEIP